LMSVPWDSHAIQVLVVCGYLFAAGGKNRCASSSGSESGAAMRSKPGGVATNWNTGESECERSRGTARRRNGPLAQRKWNDYPQSLIARRTAPGASCCLLNASTTARHVFFDAAPCSGHGETAAFSLADAFGAPAGETIKTFKVGRRDYLDPQLLSLAAAGPASIDNVLCVRLRVQRSFTGG